jgi:hypothetical protein
MGNIKSYRDLIAWQKGISLVTDVYKLSSKMPEAEKFGLVSQITRAAISIPSNIAEGWGRETPKNFLQFLRVARGSAMEVDTLLEIAYNTHMISNEEYNLTVAKVVEVNKIIQGLINSIKEKNMICEPEVEYGNNYSLY